MKRKLIISTFALAALLLSGCTQDNVSKGEAPTQPPTAAPTTSTEVPQPTVIPQTNAVSNNDAQTEMISEEEAKLIALNHAGLTTDQVTFIKSGIDRDDGRVNYDVEFYTNDNKEYDYEIDPYTGNVLDYDYDAEYYTPSSDASNPESLTEDEAQQIALEQVPGATLQDIREFSSDYDNGKLQYEGKIYYDQKEYEFEIDGTNGTILEWDVEPIYGGNFVG